MRTQLAQVAATTESAQSLLHALLRDCDDLILLTDEQLRLVFVSPSLARVADRPGADLLQHSVVDAGLFGPAAGRLKTALQAALASGQPRRLQIDWPRDGVTSTYDVHIGVDTDRPCAPRVLALARDITEQSRVEHDLRVREREFRTLAQNWPDNIIRYGLDKRAVYCNREIEERVQVTAQRIVGRTPTEAAPPGMVGVQAYERQLEQTLATGQRGTVDLIVPHPSGEIRVHSVMFAAEQDADGVICGAIAVGRDVTDQVRTQRALAAKEREFRTLAENSPDTIIRYGPNARATYINRGDKGGAVRRAEHSVIGRKAGEIALPGTLGVDAYRAQIERALVEGESGTVELQVPLAQGGFGVHSIAIAPERDADGSICGVIAVGRDVTEQVRVRQALAAKEREFRSLAENAGDNIARWDLDLRVLYINPAMARVFGQRLEHVQGLALSQTALGMAVDLAPVEQALRRVVSEGRDEMLDLRFVAPGSAVPSVHQIHLVAERDHSGAVCSVLGIGRDISEKIAQLELIESLVRTDPLTRLANRQALHERAPGLFAAAERRGNRVGVLLLDLDQFKAINDGMGHSAGDALLREVARRLTSGLRANDLLVRLGGDEFVVLAPDVDHPQVLGTIADKLHVALAQPMTLLHRELRITVSIGVAMYPLDGQTLESLLANADTAMYHAKRSGRARTEYYRAELGEAVRHRLALEQAMRHAAGGDGLVLHFQPQVNLSDPHRILGVEALLRWQHPTLGMLAPDSFIGLAEETGMILPIGRWVMRTAAEAAVRLNRGRSEPLHVAVNVSTRQVTDDGLPALVDEVLAQTGCHPDWLSIEITESVLLQDSNRVQQALDALRARGLGIAIDDFGTGYSALNYLARFPIDCLKIDKSFVHCIGRSRRDDELVKAFVALAAALNLTTVAEGVETAEQADFLLGQGCGQAQGWLFGRPMPEDRFVAWLASRHDGC
ncbi:bifunctional diguanylate cyclase/phosphodiesterase [Ideonella sp. A 288]|uniref:bifunctional diguanylate cyclase/phosphodiesterase n=1 Tax=Ideonella sp. A 288 TaxID=1962181 RepID=UPI001303265A|nr:bifunctional diguanylate cyclase/phosphodiesterase [Ideonella sp. A 288]